jgi:GR25 family glycosyltransferase involved in LPS biosynthesis
MLEHTGLNKLEDFGPIYVINMERSEDRKEYIEDHFKKYGVSEYIFIDAIDGSKEDLNEYINNLDKLTVSNNEISCGMSHLKAISQWLETSDSEYAIIMEDDVSLETTDFWNFNWKDFFNSVDKKYDILQLAITNNFTTNTRLHLREYLDWCAAVYLIKRSYAEKLVNKYDQDGKYTFSTNRFLSVPEGVVYTGSLCYSIPLFTYTTQFESALNQEHVNTIHTSSRNQTLSYWQQNSMFKLDLI